MADSKNRKDKKPTHVEEGRKAWRDKGVAKEKPKPKPRPDPTQPETRNRPRGDKPD